METFRKIIVGKKNAKNLCLANDNEWLVIAPLNEKRPFNLSESEHYFLGVDTKKPSRYRWVKSLDISISVLDLARRFSIEPTEELILHCEKLLKRADKEMDGTPMACSYSEYGILSRKRELEVHRVIFYDA
jgi:hypothetical protein